MVKEDTSFLEGEKENGLDILEELSNYADAVVNIHKDISETEELIKGMKKEERKLSEEDIPNLMLSKGLTSISLESGETIVVTEDLTAALPKDPTNRKIVLKWLIDNGGSGMIKEEINIEEPEKLLLTYLIDNRIPFDKIFNVHHATLKSFLKSKLGITKGSLQEVELGDIPKEVNVFVYRKTKIK